jgi:hypothetical protein
VIELPVTEHQLHEIQRTLRRLYRDGDVPTEVRRRILEASVRAPEDWHRDAVQAAYASGDALWRLTAVFCMRWIRGFDELILKELESADPLIRREAVLAAGCWGIESAWRTVAALVRSRRTEKSLLLAAIESVASIRPDEAIELLEPLAESEDDDIADAASEALVMARSAGNLDEDEP